MRFGVVIAGVLQMRVGVCFLLHTCVLSVREERGRCFGRGSQFGPMEIQFSAYTGIRNESIITLLFLVIARVCEVKCRICS